MQLDSRRQLGPLPSARFNLSSNLLAAANSSPGSLQSASTVLIGGVPVKIRTTPNQAVTQQRLHKLFDKTKRKDMTPDQLMEYTDKVTKPVLGRKYLLRLPPSDPEGTELLSTLSNNQQSLETFRAHLALLDCLDVTEVYSPIDCLNSSALGPECFNLFDNYATLTKDQVMLSNKYLITWVDEPYIQENMNFLKMALKANVDPDLWNRCYEEHLCAPVECQSGPLMLYLVLHRLQNCSETTLNLLLIKVRNLNIKDHAGEDIDHIVRLVNTAVTLLKSSSNEDRNYITHDFSKDLLHLFQTTSVPAFNQVFADIESSKQVEADSIGSPVVQWPTLDSITQLALRTYHRMNALGAWVKDSRPPPAFNATVSTWKPGCCFNCGEPGHNSRDCPKPTNQSLFDANLEAYKEWRKSHPKTHGQSGRGSGRGGGGGRGNGSGRGRGTQGGRGGGRGKPLRKFASDGKPLKLNEHGLYVLDQAKWQKQQKAQTIEKLAAVLSTAGVGDSAVAAIAGAASSPPSAPPPTTPAAAPAASSSDDRTARLREAIARCF